MGLFTPRAGPLLDGDDAAVIRVAHDVLPELSFAIQRKVREDHSFERLRLICLSDADSSDAGMRARCEAIQTVVEELRSLGFVAHQLGPAFSEWNDVDVVGRRVTSAS